MEIINYSMEITAADTGKRIIAGKIAPFNEVGNTSAGATIFSPGSITASDPKQIKLQLEHDKKQPIGRMIELTASNEGLFGTFKVSQSSRGTDALIEASEGIRSGLSVGIEVSKSSRDRAGNLVVTAAILKEVSLVSAAAFDSAAVTQIAASQENEPEGDSITPPTEQPNESGAKVDTTTQAAPENVAASNGDQERDTIKASNPVSVPVGYTTPRNKPLSAGQYLKHKLVVTAALANGGSSQASEESRRILAHADEQSSKFIEAAFDDAGNYLLTAANDSTTTNTGLTLPTHLQKFITNTFDGRRPAIDASTKAPLVETGMSFTIPRLTGAPTVATVAEGAAVSDTGTTSDYITVNVVKKAGKNKISFELIDRSAPPFFDLFMNELNKAYAKDTDTLQLTTFAGGTQGTLVAATAAGLQSFIATESAAAYKNTGGDFAKNLVASTDQWAAIMGYADSTGRPLYFAAGTSFNAAGAVRPDSLVGNVLQTDLYVDHNITAAGLIDDSMFLVAPDSVMYWESPMTQLRLNVLATGEIEVEVYAYCASQLLKTAGVRRYNV